MKMTSLRWIPKVLGMLLFTNSLLAQDFSGVAYGSQARQFVDIYLGQSTCPTPVYFDAHFNGGTTAMPQNITDSLTQNGIAVVSWESLTTIASPADILTGWNDARLMFAWVKANASTYNFDTTNFIIGGSSRGTILSWRQAHLPDPDIKGLYMYNALPGNAWADSTIWYPPGDISVNSPPIFMVYGREPGCSMDPVNPDIHDPLNGFKIQDEYDRLGIGMRDTLIHSISDSANTDRYQYLLAFAFSVIDPCWTVGSEEVKVDSQLQAFPNPFQDHIRFTELPESTEIIICNNLGQVLWQGISPEEIDTQDWPKGIYLIHLRWLNQQKTLKVLKPAAF